MPNERQIICKKVDKLVIFIKFAETDYGKCSKIGELSTSKFQKCNILFWLPRNNLDLKNLFTFTFNHLADEAKVTQINVKKVLKCKMVQQSCQVRQV